VSAAGPQNLTARGLIGPPTIVWGWKLSRLIRADWHIHTHLSDCGTPEATPEAIIRVAKEAGLEAIGLTDHVILREHRRRPAMVRAQVEKETNGLRVYVGCEADMQSPTRATIDEEFAAGLDYVIMSASHLYVSGVERPRDLSPRSMAALILELTTGAIESGLADIVAHPFGVPESPFTFDEIVSEVDEEALLRRGEEAARAGVAFECNPRYLRRSPGAAGWLFSCLLETGVKLAVSSDAHHPQNVGCQGPQYATEAELREAGIVEDCLWRIEDRKGAARGRAR